MFINNKCKIYFISSGPGGIGYISIESLLILKKAQIIFYDYLVSEELLSLFTSSIKIPVGKQYKEKIIEQNLINNYLVNYYNKNYNFIVRLKSGDAMLFSRINEEILHLKKNNIKYEIILGITSGFLAAKVSNILLTKRNIFNSIYLFTSVNQNDNIFDFKKSILIQYMCRQNLFNTLKKLLFLGYSLLTPIIIIENCSYINEHIFYTKMKFIKIYLSKTKGPLILIINYNFNLI